MADRTSADLRAGAESAVPAPVQPDTRKIVATGTALWFLLFVGLLPFYGWLGTHDHRIWLWTSLAGWVLGLIGLAIIRRHRAGGRAR